MPTLFSTDGKQLGDVIVAEGDIVVTRDSRRLSNAGEEEMVLPCGYPCDITSETAVTALLAAGIANCNALLLESCVIPAGESALVPLLARGPAAVNQDKLPTVDYAGDDIDMEDFNTAIDAMILVVRRKESPTQGVAEE